MKRFVSIGLFLVMALAVWWSITRDYSQQRLRPAKDRHYIELFMNQFEITTMDDSGKPAYRLHGEHLQRYNDTNVTEVRQPVFYLLEEGKQWKVSADAALVNNRKHTIRLKNNVLMQQQNTEPALVIRTQKLLINTRQQLARTNDIVDIEHGKSYLQARGMVFNNISSKLQLKSQVKGYYLPYE